MKRKFDIDLPDIDINPEDEKNRIRAFLNENRDKHLPQIMLFLYKLQPSTTNELSKVMTSYYKRPFEKGHIYYMLKKLMLLGLVSSAVVSDVMVGNKRDSFYKDIVGKHQAFLDKIPDNFKNNFNKVVYFYVNKFGEGFVEWCAQISGFKAKKR